MRSHLVHWFESFLPWDVAALIAPSWFTCIGLAGVVGLLLTLIMARRHDVDRGAIASIVLWGYAAAVIAGIVVPMFIDVIHQQLTTGQVRLRWAGMTSFWGYLAGFAVVAIECREHKIPLAKFGDLATVPLGATLVFARLGCFVGGCDYGKVTSVPWAVRFPEGSPAWHNHVGSGLVPGGRAESLAVHPTQLYEAMLGVLIIVVGLWVGRLAWARANHGRIVVVGIATYAIGRIVVEMFRADVSRGIYLGLSSGQIFSICVLVAIVLGFVMTRRRAVQVVAPVTVALGVLLGRVGGAAAQPVPLPRPQQQPQQPQPAPQPPAPPSPPSPYPAAPPPAQAPYPAQPNTYWYGQPPPQQPQQPYAPLPPQPQSAIQASPRNWHFEIGLLGGVATALNRRSDQVAPLAGPTLSAGFLIGAGGLWLDLDSLGNRDASHGTVLVTGGVQHGVGDKVKIAYRAGLGRTLVNFDEPAFRDVSGLSLRFDVQVDYPLGGSLALWARPFSLDILTAPALGGPITTWQVRLGAAYRFGGRGKSQPAPAPAPPSNTAPPGALDPAPRARLP